MVPPAEAPDPGLSAQIHWDWWHVPFTPEEAHDGPMDTPATYFRWSFILLSVPNLLLIAGMIVLFVIALFIPMGHDDPHEGEGPHR